MTEFFLIRTRESLDPAFPGQEGVFYTPDGKALYSLERGLNDPDHAGIPEGRYKVIPGVMATSGHHRAQLVAVPGRSGIFIHNANYASQLEGCIAVAAQYQGFGKIGVGMADHVNSLVVADPNDSWITVRNMA